MVAGLRLVMIRFVSPIAVIIEIHFGRLSAAAVPPENKPPLLVHADRMPADEGALQLF